MVRFPSPNPSMRPLARTVFEIFEHALDAADPYRAVRRSIHVENDRLRTGSRTYDLATTRRTILVSVGKAARAMARGVEDALGPRLDMGLGITVESATEPGPRGFSLAIGGHPLPTESGLEASRTITATLEDTTEDDLVIVCISGGASALMELPVAGISLDDLRSVTSAMLASGATIREINSVRKHLSRLKGGGLAAACAPARVLALVLSDVVGSSLDVIASGPTSADPSTFRDALEVIAHCDPSAVPSAVRAHLQRGNDGLEKETPKPNDALFARVHNLLVGDNAHSVDAAAKHARDLGYATCVLTTELEGEAKEAGKFLAAIAREVKRRGTPVEPPACLIAGGETTVTLGPNPKRGGRNQELALSLALSLEGCEDFVAGAMGTDGIDGASLAAGAIVDGSTVARAEERGLDARTSLVEHDSGTLFERLNDAIVTGPTGTNVNDLVVLLIDRPSS